MLGSDGWDHGDIFGTSFVEYCWVLELSPLYEDTGRGEGGKCLSYPCYRVQVLPPGFLGMWKQTVEASIIFYWSYCWFYTVVILVHVSVFLKINKPKTCSFTAVICTAIFFSKQPEYNVVREKQI